MALLEPVEYGHTGHLKSPLYSLAYVVDYDCQGHKDEQSNDDHGCDKPRFLCRGGTAGELELLAPTAPVAFITSDKRYKPLRCGKCVKANKQKRFEVTFIQADATRV